MLPEAPVVSCSPFSPPPFYGSPIAGHFSPRQDCARAGPSARTLAASQSWTGENHNVASGSNVHLVELARTAALNQALPDVGTLRSWLRRIQEAILGSSALLCARLDTVRCREWKWSSPCRRKPSYFSSRS